MTTFEIFRNDGTMITTTTVPPLSKTNVNALMVIPGVTLKVLIKRDSRFKTCPIVHMFINNTYRIEHTLQSNESRFFCENLFESSNLTIQPALNDVNIVCPITGDYLHIVKGKMYLRFVVVYPYKEIVYKHGSIGYYDRDGDDVAAKHVYDVYLASSQEPPATTFCGKCGYPKAQQQQQHDVTTESHIVVVDLSNNVLR